MAGSDLRRERSFTGLIRALVLIYWVTLAVFGCSRLFREGWGASLAVIHAWYMAALVFLAVWAPAAMIASLLIAKGEPKSPRARPRADVYRLR